MKAQPLEQCHFAKWVYLLKMMQLVEVGIFLTERNFTLIFLLSEYACA